MIRKIKLKDIAVIDRVKKGEVYKKGTIYIGASATHDEDIHILDEDGEIPDKYVYVLLNEDINKKYYYYCILSQYKEWYHRHIQNINMTISDIRNMRFKVNDDEQKQRLYLARMEYIEKEIKSEKETIALCKLLKESMLDKMFPNNK